MHDVVLLGFLHVVRCLFHVTQAVANSTPFLFFVCRLPITTTTCLVFSDSKRLRCDFMPFSVFIYLYMTCRAAQLFDPQHRVLHELGASSDGDRAKWVDTLTKASRFSKGSVDEKRQAALSKSLLVTTRAASDRRITGGGLGGPGSGFVARVSGRADRSRWVFGGSPRCFCVWHCVDAAQGF